MKTSYPIILAHGVYPFHRVLPFIFNTDNRADDGRHYFKGIRNHLIRYGFSAFHSRVSWGGSLDRRAFDLKREIERITGNFTLWPRVHIIAHSMGGLDARWMIYKHDLPHRIASLTTIGTPHHGTVHADQALRRYGPLLLLLERMGIDLSGVKSLTRKRARELNRLMEQTEQESGVLFRTVVGVQSREHLFFPLRGSHDIIMEHEGPNDGLVSLSSAMWKQEYFWRQIDADHLNQLGWWAGPRAMGTNNRTIFEKRIKELYLKLARTVQESQSCGA